VKNLGDILAFSSVMNRLRMSKYRGSKTLDSKATAANNTLLIVRENVCLPGFVLLAV
jgi:hypothetical protein